MAQEKEVIRLSEEKLEKVIGGIKDEQLAGDFVLGDQRAGYCKYCGVTRTLEYCGSSIGYEGGKVYPDICNKWKCLDSNCQQENYYSKTSGFLLE